MDFINFNGEILKKKPNNFEKADINDSDIMFIKAVAIEEGVNANNALFERDDLEKAKNTFIGKPLKIRFINNNPTGHGYDPNTGIFDEFVKNIGYIYDANSEVVMPDGTIHPIYYNEDIPEGGKYRIVVYMAMWQDYYPEIANRLRELHANNDLKFSIEATRDFTITPEGYRKCYNILFNGLCVVQNPAFENAKSLIVAEILKNQGGNNMDFEKLYNESLEKINELSSNLTLKEKEVETLKTEVAEVKEKLAETTGTIKSIETERDKYKAIVETAEKAKLGEERYAKLLKYGEVKQTKEELAEMDKEAFVELLEKTVESFVPKEEKETSEVLGVPYEKTVKDKMDRKQKLLEFIQGLSR